MKKTFQIAIDGPVAAGKGTTAKLVATRLGFVYVDSGALYRALTLFTIRSGVDWQNEVQTVALIEHESPIVELLVPEGETQDGRLVTVRLNNEDVSWLIRTEEVSKATSPVAQYSAVRDYVNKLAREMAKTQNIVMEGRDITGVVLPDADLKIYMDAEPMERAARRHRELLTRGVDITLQQVHDDLVERDARDMERNLKKVTGVWVLDTTGMTIEEVVEAIVARVEKIRKKEA